MTLFNHCPYILAYCSKYLCFLFHCRYVDLNRQSYTLANGLKTMYGYLPSALVSKTAEVILHIIKRIQAIESTVYQVSFPFCLI